MEPNEAQGKGRPRLPADRKRSEVIFARVTPKEASAIRRYAKAQGVSVTYMVRTALEAILAGQE